jgi:hypothetical protein
VALFLTARDSSVVINSTVYLPLGLLEESASVLVKDSTVGSFFILLLGVATGTVISPFWLPHTISYSDSIFVNN